MKLHEYYTIIANKSITWVSALQQAYEDEIRVGHSVLVNKDGNIFLDVIVIVLEKETMPPLNLIFDLEKMDEEPAESVDDIVEEVLSTAFYNLQHALFLRVRELRDNSTSEENTNESKDNNA